jgi:hypothetical protein
MLTTELQTAFVTVINQQDFARKSNSLRSIGPRLGTTHPSHRKTRTESSRGLHRVQFKAEVDGEACQLATKTKGDCVQEHNDTPQVGIGKYTTCTTKTTGDRYETRSDAVNPSSCDTLDEILAALNLAR